MKIAENSVVKLEYTLSKDGHAQPEVLQTVMMGQAHPLLRGLEPKLYGHEVSDVLELDLSVPFDGSMRISAPLETLPDGLQPGETVAGEDSAGVALLYRVIALEGSTAILDANPENAGYKVVAQVRVLEVRLADEAELEHGHAHGADGVKH